MRAVEAWIDTLPEAFENLTIEDIRIREERQAIYFEPAAVSQY